MVPHVNANGASRLQESCKGQGLAGWYRENVHDRLEKAQQVLLTKNPRNAGEGMRLGSLKAKYREEYGELRAERQGQQ